eukprot:s157_g16.t1
MGRTWQDKRFLYVIMERIKGGELFEALKSELAVITEQDMSRVSLQLLKALEYLHSCRVVHRDIKAQNILLTEPPLLPGRALCKADIKVIDFGLSARLPQECCWRQNDRSFDIVCGTPACCAPEIWATQEGALPIWKKRFGFRYGAKVDVYAAGVVIYMALLGQLPYYAETSLKLARLVCSKDSYPSFESKDGSHQVSSRCREFLSRLLEKDPNSRCTAAQAARHPWLSGRAKRSIPQPIPLQVRSSAAAEAKASLEQCLPECEHNVSLKEKNERVLALAQAHRDWSEGLEVSSDSESDEFLNQVPTLAELAPWQPSPLPLAVSLPSLFIWCEFAVSAPLAIKSCHADLTTLLVSALSVPQLPPGSGRLLRQFPSGCLPNSRILSTTPSPQFFSNMLCASVGVELAIFFVTLSVAFIFSQVGKKNVDAKKLKGSSGEERCPSWFSWKLPVAKAVEPCKAAPVQKKPLCKQEPQLSSARSSSSCGSASRRLDEIATSARDQHASRNVGQVIQMYDDFLSSLAEKHMQIPEVASSARHSAVEFFAALVYCVVRAGRFNLVERLLDDMVAQGVARPLQFYESTMKQLAGVKKYKLALAVYDRLSADGLQPSAVTLSCLINFAVEVGELNRAIQFFKVLSTVSKPSIRAYMTVLRVHSMRQDWPATLWTIRDMRRRGVEVDTLAMNVALSTGVVADHIEEVEALLAEAPSVDIVSYNTLVKGYAQRSDLAKAQQVLAKLLERGLRPNAITFNTVMDAAVRSGEVCQAWQLFDSMSGRGLRPDRFTCSILVKGLTKRPTARLLRESLAL